MKYLLICIIILLSIQNTYAFTSNDPSTINNCTCEGTWKLVQSPHTSDADWYKMSGYYPKSFFIDCNTKQLHLEWTTNIKCDDIRYINGRTYCYENLTGHTVVDNYSCIECQEPSDPTPTPPEDTNTTEWKLVGETSCTDENVTLPNVCTDTNASDIVVQTWKTGCCGDNSRCYQSVPKCDDNETLDTNSTPPQCVPTIPTCDDNETLDTSFDPPKCVPTVPTCDDNETLDTSFDPPKCVPTVPTCEEEDTEFPKPPENYKPYPSLDCSALPNSIKQTRRINCKDEHRCFIPDNVCIPIEPISSYVSPKGQVFHEDITIDGADFNLHYQSRFVNDGIIAKGWGISVHHRLIDDNLQLGSGAYIAPNNTYVENNHTIVVFSSNEMLFDANGRLQSIRDLYTKETKTTFSYDFVGRLVTLTDIYGQITTIERDSSGQVEAIVAPTEQRTLLKVNSEGDLVEVQYEDTSSYTFEYERHLMTVETEPNGNRFLHFFDDSGKVVKVIDAEQGEWHFDWLTYRHTSKW